MSDVPQMTPGGISFAELASTNIKESEDFYSKFFGWQCQSHGDNFSMFSAPGGFNGGFCTDYTPSAEGAVLYINCDGVAAKLAEVEAAGGAVLVPSTPLPENWGHMGHFKDPHGNRLGLWSLAP